jgi:predicted S18 family serine protease
MRNLQTYIIVQERLDERDKLVDDARRLFSQYLKKEANITEAIYKLAFARERLYSALAWSSFFQMDAKDSEFSEEDLRSSCTEKLMEAQERMQYAEIFFPVALTATKKELDQAVIDNRNQDYELCLFRSSKVKAESNVILGAMNVNRDQLPTLVKEKLDVAKQIIAEQKSFPIVAYSYYQYGNSLLETDPASALLYAEYALELANLDIYFKQKHETKKAPKQIIVPKNFLLLSFILGFLLGSGLVLLLLRKKGKTKKIKKKKGLAKTGSTLKSKRRKRKRK